MRTASSPLRSNCLAGWLALLVVGIVVLGGAAVSAGAATTSAHDYDATNAGTAQCVSVALSADQLADDASTTATASVIHDYDAAPQPALPSASQSSRFLAPQTDPRCDDNRGRIQVQGRALGTAAR